MKKRKLLLNAALGIVIALSAGTWVACKNGTETSVPQSSQAELGEPVITVSGVPTSGIIGREVVLPAATAKDSAGADVSVSVKLTVAGLKEDGTVGREFIYREAANVSRKFTPAQYTNYSIVYELKDSYGNSAKQEFAFVAEADTAKPVITVIEEGYNEENGIQGDALNGLTLPAISVVDQPGDIDVTSSATYSIMSGDVEVAPAQSYEAGKKVYIAAAGEYTLVINAKDTAGNAADPLSVMVNYEENAQTGVNLISEDRVVVGQDAYINEYGELCVGASANGGHSDPNNSSSYATLGGINIQYGQIVALSVNMDIQPADAYNWFFQIGFSLNQTDLIPSGSECVWPDFEVRFFNDKTQVHGTGNDVAGLYQTTGSIRDGKDHTIYLGLYRNGSGPEDPAANLCICMWIDDLTNAKIFTTVSVAGDGTGLGIMNQDAFTKAWNNEMHYLMFGSVSFNGPAEKVNDIMTIKSIVVQPMESGAPDATYDIIAPTLSVNGEIRKAYDVNEAMNLPEATANGGEEVLIYLTNDKGERVQIGRDYVPTKKGSYKLSYVACDEAGNYSYSEYEIKILDKDLEVPVLTISNKADISAMIGEAFNVPTATATDNIDGDISSAIIVNVLGAAWAKDIGAGKIPENYTIMAAGVHYLEYVVCDAYGNETRETVKVTVGGSVTGDVLPSVVGYDEENELLNLYNSSMTYADQQILNERVSMILNFKTMGNFEINMAGPRGTVDGYAQGIMLRIYDTRVEIRVNGNNGFRIGLCRTGPFASRDEAGNLVASNRDIVLDWQITEETLTNAEGVTYDVLRFRIWIDGVELQMEASNGFQYADLAGEANDGGYGLCLIRSTAEDDPNAVYALENGMKCTHLYQASELYMASTADTNVDVKGIRIDGKSFADEQE